MTSRILNGFRLQFQLMPVIFRSRVASGRQVVSEALEVQSNSTLFLSFLFSEGLVQVHVLVACASSSTFELDL